MLARYSSRNSSSLIRVLCDKTKNARRIFWYHAKGLVIITVGLYWCVFGYVCMVAITAIKQDCLYRSPYSLNASLCEEPKLALIIRSNVIGCHRGPKRKLRTGYSLVTGYCLLCRLQSMMNAGARLIFQLRRSDHITDALLSLHWLRVPERIRYKIAVQTDRHTMTANTALA